MRRDFDQWMAEKHTELEFYYEPRLDEGSASARFRHAGWSVFRKRVWESLRRTDQSTSRRRSFGECGSYSWIEKHDTRESDYRIRYNHCHDRLCTPCANARSARLRDALLDLIGTTPVSFITLTLCGKGEALGDLVDRLYKHFRALRLHPLWADAVRGGAAFLEVKWSDKAQRWHPHLHVIADTGYIDQGELSTAWRSISRDSYIVDIRRVRNPQVTGHYVTKYASKPLNTSFSNTPHLLDEALLALKGRRLCLCFGTWYGTPLSNAEEEVLDDGTTPSEHYKMFADLETVLAKANAGDRDAIQLLTAAGAEARWRASLTPISDSS